MKYEQQIDRFLFGILLILNLLKIRENKLKIIKLIKTSSFAYNGTSTNINNNLA